MKPKHNIKITESTALCSLLNSFVCRALQLIVLSTCGLTSCSNERPLGPLPTQLRIYIGAIDYSDVESAHSRVFVYDFDSLALIDSFSLPARSFDLLADDDGQSLFALTTGANFRTRAIWKFDLLTKKPIWHHDFNRWVEPLDGLGRLYELNGGLWLLANRTIFTSTSGDIIKTLPDHQVPFAGPASSTHVALGLVPHGEQFPFQISGYDVSRDTSWGEYLPHLEAGTELEAVFTARLHPDLRRVLAIGAHGQLQNSWFVVGDLNSGETLLEHELIYPGGEIAISSDGAIAIVTDPSRTGILDSYATLDIFNLDSMKHMKRFTQSSTGPGLLSRPGQLALVPGTNVLLTAPPADLSSTGGLLVVDFQDLELLKTFWLPGKSPTFEYFIGGLDVGATTAPR